MPCDRYLRTVLTIIALELLWLGVKDLATPVSAQAAATRVVIAGVDIESGSTRQSFLPVGVLGSYRSIPPDAAATLLPQAMRVTGDVAVVVRTPVRVIADTPLKVEADKPLPVQNVDYVPRPRPGE